VSHEPWATLPEVVWFWLVMRKVERKYDTYRLWRKPRRQYTAVFIWHGAYLLRIGSSRATRHIGQQLVGRGGGVVVRVSDLGLKDPGFDPRAVPKSECMFVNIYHC